MRSFERMGLLGGVGVAAVFAALAPTMLVDCVNSSPTPVSPGGDAALSFDSAAPAADATSDATVPPDSGPSLDAGTDATTLGVDAGDAGTDAMVTGVDAAEAGSDAGGDASTPLEAGPCTGTVLDSGACFVVLATAQDKPTGIAVYGTSVYWTDMGSSANTGTVNSAPIGGGSRAVLANGQEFPSGVAVDATGVYWVNEGDATSQLGTVMTTAPDGGTLTLASGQAGPLFLALQGGYVYFGNLDDAPAGIGNNISSVPKTGSPDGGATVLAAAGEPWGIATDSNNVYWAGGANSTYSVPLDGGAVVEVTNLGLQGIATGGSNLFVCGGQGLIIAPKVDPSMTNFAVGNQYLCWAVATDATNVYWSDDFQNIWSLPQQDGGTPQAIYTLSTEKPMGIAVDALNVYWVTNTGRVLQISK